MTVTKKKKNERLDFRISSVDKLKIQRAMAFLGVSTADFVLKRIMPDVERVIAEEEKIHLNNEAWTGFVNLLQSPKPASASLKSAMQEYRKTQGV